MTEFSFLGEVSL